MAIAGAVALAGPLAIAATAPAGNPGPCGGMYQPLFPFMAPVPGSHAVLQAAGCQGLHGPVQGALLISHP